jgi:hypothetical protein
VIEDSLDEGVDPGQFLTQRDCSGIDRFPTGEWPSSPPKECGDKVRPAHGAATTRRLSLEAPRIEGRLPAGSQRHCRHSDEGQHAGRLEVRRSGPADRCHTCRDQALRSRPASAGRTSARASSGDYGQADLTGLYPSGWPSVIISTTKPQVSAGRWPRGHTCSHRSARARPARVPRRRLARAASRDSAGGNQFGHAVPPCRATRNRADHSRVSRCPVLRFARACVMRWLCGRGRGRRRWCRRSCRGWCGRWRDRPCKTGRWRQASR